MNRRDVLITLSTATMAACTTTRGKRADPTARRREIDSGATRALDELQREVPGSRQLLTRAQGVLVFPNVVSAGLVVGGTYGEGVLRSKGATTAYYQMAGGSFGFLAGAQSRAIFVLFMTPDALQKFSSSNGWTAGVDASIAVLEKGADVQATTQTLQQPVIGYVLTNKGLMANLSLNGTKITRLQL